MASVPATVEQAREAQASALASGDASEANRAYARELRALESAEADAAALPEGVEMHPEAVNLPALANDGGTRPVPMIINPDTGDAFACGPCDGAELDAIRALLSHRPHGDGTAWGELQRRWPGADLAANLGFILAMSARYPEVAELIDGSNLAGDPDMLQHVAQLGRQMAHGTSTTKGADMADSTFEAAVDEADTLETIRSEIDRYQRAGNSKMATCGSRRSRRTSRRFMATSRLSAETGDGHERDGRRHGGQRGQGAGAGRSRGGDEAAEPSGR